LDHDLFVREIRDNRHFIRELTGTNPSHFCYPSGRYDAAFLPWLREEGVTTATTCRVDLANRAHEPLLLPRFVDNMRQSSVRFESWCSGAAALLPRSESHRYEQPSE
jgi:peptidoglycan/xylan/chitin deacetylase (PgdA/CDA1 family)